jgi:hypothetical protein
MVTGFFHYLSMVPYPCSRSWGARLSDPYLFKPLGGYYLFFQKGDFSK